MTHTIEQEYGIYYFLKEAKNDASLFQSVYFNLENSIIKENKYLGSPGLAMSILKNTTNKFYFFDIETAALSNIIEFAETNQIIDHVTAINQNSIVGTFDLLPTLSQSALIHIDPYNIDQPSSNGKDYLDIFVEASELGIQCILWYGFNTLDEKNTLNNFIINKLSNKNINNVLCIELIMDIIQKDQILCNPGILGNGLLTSNLSQISTAVIENYSESLTALYQKSQYKGYKGSMHRDIIIKS